MALGALDIGSPDTRKRPREDTQRAAIEDAWSKTTLACPLKCPESIAKKIQFGEGSYITLCRSVPVEKERSVLVVCQESGITDFLDPTTFTVVGKSVRHASSTLSMDCDTPLEATESAWIGLGYRDGWVKVYDADSHKLVRKFEKVHELGVSTVVFVGNKRADALQGHSPFLLSGSFDTTMCLLDISSGASLFQVKDAHHSSFINSICVLPFRIGVYTLSSGNDGSLAFWSLGKADSPAVERCGNVIPLQRVSPDCGDGVASSLSLLPSTSSAPSRCELVVATNVDKVLLCGVEMGLGESGEAAFDVVPFAILQCGKPILSVSYGVPNANFVSFYVCDCEGLLYLYNMELDSERQKDAKVSVMSPVDVSSLLVIEHGDNVKEARADVVYPHSGNPMLSIYSASFPELYLVQ
ncbi:hypothetical protein, conserved [Angomonas deanei]|uniref:WD domain, G-beta repeat n=1 Tax=Angomonas deanei TaxID=59799 RepID=A0A7G2C7Z0_9TRYP|nr:hypothetical protein, conserved [Angomonas deanei]